MLYLFIFPNIETTFFKSRDNDTRRFEACENLKIALLSGKLLTIIWYSLQFYM